MQDERVFLAAAVRDDGLSREHIADLKGREGREQHPAHVQPWQAHLTQAHLNSFETSEAARRLSSSLQAPVHRPSERIRTANVPLEMDDAQAPTARPSQQIIEDKTRMPRKATGARAGRMGGRRTAPDAIPSSTLDRISRVLDARSGEDGRRRQSLAKDATKDFSFATSPAALPLVCRANRFAKRLRPRGVSASHALKKNGERVRRRRHWACVRAKTFSRRL